MRIRILENTGRADGTDANDMKKFRHALDNHKSVYIRLEFDNRLKKLKQDINVKCLRRIFVRINAIFPSITAV